MSKGTVVITCFPAQGLWQRKLLQKARGRKYNKDRNQEFE